MVSSGSLMAEQKETQDQPLRTGPHCGSAKPFVILAYSKVPSPMPRPACQMASDADRSERSGRGLAVHARLNAGLGLVVNLNLPASGEEGHATRLHNQFVERAVCRCSKHPQRIDLTDSLLARRQ